MTSSKKPINLLRGWPAPSLLPTAQISAASQAALSKPTVSVPALFYGPDPGYQPLRVEVSKWLSDFYSAPDSPDPERICITGGASQNLACILQVFTDPNITRRIWMVAPSYFLASKIFEDAGFGGRLRGVGEGDGGVDVESLERMIREVDEKERDDVKVALKPKRSYSKIYRHIIYCVPTFSNPSGKTMTLACRKQLVDLARRYDALIITDDVYDFLQWPTSLSQGTLLPSRAVLPRLVDIDRSLGAHASDPHSFGNAVSNGSFSKIVAPGCRTGWAEASTKFVYGLSQTGSSRSGGAPSQLTSTFITEMLQNGALQKHISTTLQPTYQKRYSLMMRAIQQYLVPLGTQVSTTSLQGHDLFGGYFIWFELPVGIVAEVLAAKAQEKENLIIAHGNLFEVTGDTSIKFDNCVRVCFSFEDEECLEEGIKRLARVVEEMQSGNLDGRNGAKQDESSLKKPLREFF